MNESPATTSQQILHNSSHVQQNVRRRSINQVRPVEKKKNVAVFLISSTHDSMNTNTISMHVSAETQLHASDFCGSHQWRCNCLRINHSIKPPCWKRIKAQVCRHDDAPWAAPTPPPPLLKQRQTLSSEDSFKRLFTQIPPQPPPQFNNLMAFGHAGGADLELE